MESLSLYHYIDYFRRDATVAEHFATIPIIYSQLKSPLLLFSYSPSGFTILTSRFIALRSPHSPWPFVSGRESEP